MPRLEPLAASSSSSSSQQPASYGNNRSSLQAMKRKFSFSLAPMKMPSRSDNKAIRESLASRYVTPPSSPLIERRPLSPKTEQELRAACTALVNDYTKPAGRARDVQVQSKANIDFETLHQSMKEKRAELTASVGTQTLPRAAQNGPDAALPTAAPRPARYAHRPHGTISNVLPQPESSYSSVQANISRRRDALNNQLACREEAAASRVVSTHAYQEFSKPSKSRNCDRPKTAPMPIANDAPDTSSSTPLSGSTDQHCDCSTGLTSVAMRTPSRTSKRASRPLTSDQLAANQADAATSEWMKQALDKRRSPYAEPCGNPPAPSRSSRASSRARSIRDEIREYWRPGRLSRTASRESIQSRSSVTSSSNGWRSWGFQRWGSRERLSDDRSSIERGRSERRSGEGAKSELNLNRELPPLPGLDQWQEPQNRTSVHIVSLMRPRMSGDAHQVQISPTGDTFQGAHGPAKSQNSIPVDSRRSQQRDEIPTQAPASHYDFDSLMNHMKRSRSNGQTSRTRRHSIFGVSPTVNQESQATSGTITVEQHRSDTPNFSRKYSSDRRRVYDPRYPNIVEISTVGQSSGAQEKSPKGLRKVLGGFMLSGKKEKKQSTWMDKLEQRGIKGGIMVHDEAAGAPVVRY